MIALFRSDGRVALRIALVIGLAIRLVVLTQTSQLGTPIRDEQHYTQLATSLLEGNGFGWGPGQLTSMRPPLYPAVVSSIWAVAGAGSLQTIRFVQILLALATVWLVFELGRRAFDVKVGRWAAAIFWLYPSLIYFNFTILTETIFTLLLVAFLLLTVMLVQAPRVWTAVAAGAVLGLGALVRSVMWPLPLVLCPMLLLMLQASWPRRAALAGLVFAGYAAVVAPWAVRNTRLQGVPTVVDTMGGVNLRLGNYEHTPEDRMWAAIDLMTGDKEWSYELTQQNPGQRFTEGQKDKWAQSAGLRYIRQHPGQSFRRSLIKFSDFWGIEREFIASVQHGAISPPGWFAALAGASIVFAYLIVVIAGGMGVWLVAPAWRVHVMLLLPLLLTTAVHTIVFGHSRYHIPFMPILGLYAAALLTLGIRRSFAASPGVLARAGAVMTVAVLAFIWARQFIIVDADRIRALFSNGS